MAFTPFLEDPEIRVVGGDHRRNPFAYSLCKACPESGRSVCTSTKEMVATYGAVELQLAPAGRLAHNCASLPSCSRASRARVAALPIITPMHQCLAANVSIPRWRARTAPPTSFMLTKMVCGRTLGFDEVSLKIAQGAGHAETKDRRPVDVGFWPGCLPQRRSPLIPFLRGWFRPPASTPVTSSPGSLGHHRGRWLGGRRAAIELCHQAHGVDDEVGAATAAWLLGVEPCLVPRSHQLVGGVDDDVGD